VTGESEATETGEAGEAVWESHPSVLALVPPAVSLPVVVGLCTYGLVRVPIGAVRVVVAGFALLALVALVVRPLLAWNGSLLVLTRERLGVRSGVVARAERDLPLAQVAEVRTEQRAGQRLVRVGTLVVLPAGGGEPLVAERLPRVRRLQALVLALAEEAGADGLDDSDAAEGDEDDEDRYDEDPDVDLDDD
jgi:uncharacterized membrane protein YdbT with pleckstrin-like domain